MKQVLPKAILTEALARIDNTQQTEAVPSNPTSIPKELYLCRAG